MEQGIIPVNKEYDIAYRYYDRDSAYKYFNRKFEIMLVTKNKSGSERNIVLLLDNCDPNNPRWFPHLHKPGKKSKYYFGVATLNWNDIKKKFLSAMCKEIGDQHADELEAALDTLFSPKLS